MSRWYDAITGMTDEKRANMAREHMRRAAELAAQFDAEVEAYIDSQMPQKESKPENRFELIQGGASKRDK
jgi:hypothetical protein